MPLRRSLQARLAGELPILKQYFPSFRWKLDGTTVTVEGTVKTNSGKEYKLRIELPNDYPSSVPAMYVIEPKPLRGMRGWDLAELGANPLMHTLSPKNGAVAICHYHPDFWDPQQTIYKVVVKGRIWLEALEAHVRTELPMDTYLAHQG